LNGGKLSLNFVSFFIKNNNEFVEYFYNNFILNIKHSFEDVFFIH